MKKENHSKNKSRTMTKKSVPKSMKSILSALTDFVIEVVGDGNDDTIRQAMIDNQDDLFNILKSFMPTEKSSIKKVKDPDAPKRGKSSYIYFCIDKRDEIKKANPDMSAKDIIKELGRVWRDDVSEKDKARYVKLSDSDKSRYDNEMKDYKPPQGVGQFTEKKIKRSGPKRGLTAYIFFCKEQRVLIKEENTELSTKEMTSELGKRWSNLSDKDRKPYIKLAENDKARYEKEKTTWVKPDDEPLESKKKSKKKSKTQSKTHNKYGYVLYCKEKRPTLKSDNTDWTSNQITKELGRAWNALSEAEQGEYNDRVNDKKGKTQPEQESDLDEIIEEDDDFSQ